MNKYIVIIVGVFSFVLLYFGHSYWNNQSKAAGLAGKIAVENIAKKEKEKREALINSVKPENNLAQSLIDFLRFRALTQDKVTISIIGSNLTAGTGTSNPSNSWVELLNENLKASNDEFETLNFNNQGYEGYSTADLLNGNKIDLVLNIHPDLVIFEDSLYNNFSQSISLEKSGQQMEKIMDILQKGLPNAKILIMSTNPIAKSEDKNSLGYKYADYIRESENIISKNKWTYFNAIDEINQKLKSEQLLLVDILANDYVHLNDKGNSLLSDLLFDYFTRSNK